MKTGGKVLASIAFVSLVTSSAYAEDCRNITDVKKRLDCLEAKIEATQQSIPSLSGLKIENSQAHGFCMNYVDTTAGIVSRPCGTDYGTWNIHK